MTQSPAIDALHIVYCSESGNAVSLTMPVIDDWKRWMANGWTVDDLRTTIRYLKKTFSRNDRPEVLRGMLHFRKLIRPEYVEGGHLDFSYFEQYLCDARASQRNAPRPPDARQKVLAAVNRPTEPPKATDARQAGAIAEEVLKACAEARRQIDNL